MRDELGLHDEHTDSLRAPRSSTSVRPARAAERETPDGRDAAPPRGRPSHPDDADRLEIAWCRCLPWRIRVPSPMRGSRWATLTVRADAANNERAAAWMHAAPWRPSRCWGVRRPTWRTRKPRPRARSRCSRVRGRAEVRPPAWSTVVRHSGSRNTSRSHRTSAERAMVHARSCRRSRDGGRPPRPWISVQRPRADAVAGRGIAARAMRSSRGPGDRESAPEQSNAAQRRGRCTDERCSTARAACRSRRSCAGHKSSGCRSNYWRGPQNAGRNEWLAGDLDSAAARSCARAARRSSRSANPRSLSTHSTMLAELEVERGNPREVDAPRSRSAPGPPTTAPRRSVSRKARGLALQPARGEPSRRGSPPACAGPSSTRRTRRRGVNARRDRSGEVAREPRPRGGDATPDARRSNWLLIQGGDEPSPIAPAPS